MRIRPKQARELLVKALRSGKYRQTTGTLCGIENKEFSYCCLGVACELYNEYHAKKLPTEIHNSVCNTQRNKSYDNETTFLPEKVQKWLDCDER